MEASGAAAVIVTDQWVVSIYGDNADNCVEALLKYRNAIVTALDAKVTGTLQRTPFGEAVARYEFRQGIIGVGWQLGLALAGAVIGIALGAIFL